MNELITQGDKPVLYAIPLFLIAIFLELAIDFYQKRKIYHDAKDSLASITMGIGSLIIGVGVKAFYFLIYFWLYNNLNVFGSPEAASATLGPDKWYAWVLLFFLDDFSFYWHHRLSHEVRILWAAHVNHHSSVNLNFAVALRQSWAEIFYKYIFWLWLPILGFHPVMILTMMSISLVYQFLQHTTLVKKLGPLEWFFNTPSHHRVHHASNIKYLDRNHAGILIIWDRLFGTFQEEDEEAPQYGITVNIHTYNPIKIASHEFVAIWQDVKSAKNWKDKLKYIFYPPGWSPEGPNRTAKYLQKQLKLGKLSTTTTPSEKEVKSTEAALS
ncbi:MAG: sterol desaturase family protein [Chitinophagales bacterium]|nr:sterol desaturase family protein [Chitinophagales bacterium]